MYMNKNKNDRKYLEKLIWRQNQSSDFDIDHTNLIFVKFEFYFSCGHLYKEQQTGINDLYFTIEQKSFL